METICFDFDGVIANYDGWKGFDILGEPNYNIIEVMKKLKIMGYRLIIFTTRPATQVMVDWLKKYEVPYHAIIDDRAINYHGQNEIQLLKELDKLFNIKI